MTEKLKYKVGDKVLIEAEVTAVNGYNAPYRLEFSSGVYMCWISEENLEKSLVKLPPKPKVTQAVMDWYFKFQENNWDVESYLVDEPKPSEVDKWLYTGNRQLNLEHQHALATLIAYGPEAVEVEREKGYRVTLKKTEQHLIKFYDGGLLFRAVGEGQDTFTKQELINAGFEGVFDNPMFEVEEVEK